MIAPHDKDLHDSRSTSSRQSRLGIVKLLLVSAVPSTVRTHLHDTIVTNKIHETSTGVNTYSDSEYTFTIQGLYLNDFTKIIHYSLFFVTIQSNNDVNGSVISVPNKGWKQISQRLRGHK